MINALIKHINVWEQSITALMYFVTGSMTVLCIVVCLVGYPQ